MEAGALFWPFGIFLFAWDHICGCWQSIDSIMHFDKRLLRGDFGLWNLDLLSCGEVRSMQRCDGRLCQYGIWLDMDLDGWPNM
jgi:hypothetical protein